LFIIIFLRSTDVWIWGLLTLVFAFTPYIWACIKKELKDGLTLFDIVSNLPFFIQLKWLCFCGLRILNIALNFPEEWRCQSELIFADMDEDLMLEAFLEAAPQSALQLSILLTLGYTSREQLQSLVTSWFSLLMRSSACYFSQRSSNESINSIPIPARTLVFVSLILGTTARLISLGLLTAYLQGTVGEMTVFAPD
jgi:hypothetical protein